MLDHGNTFLSLFSGCGGLDRAIPGRCVAHVEYEPFAQRVLRRHWPDVPVLGDVREVDGRAFRGVDLVVGGPPCQAASHAGLQLGESDPRWMWPEAVRIIRETDVPRFLLENVPGLMTLNGGRSFGAVLSALTALGYFVRWDHCTAAEVGRPHLRDRVWIVGTREPHGRGWCSVPIGQVRKWPRAGWAWEGRTGEDVPRWPKRETWPLVDSRVCPPSGMWITPSVEDNGRDGSAEMAERWAAGERIPDTHHRLRTQVKMPALWPTPKASDEGDRGLSVERREAGVVDGLRVAAKLWPGPRTAGPNLPIFECVACHVRYGEHDYERNPTCPKCGGHGVIDHRERGGDLDNDDFDAPRRLWPTPDANARKGSTTPEQRHGQLTAATEPYGEGRLNPAWVESLLMGWPLGWTLPDGPSLADAPAPPRDVEIATRLTMDKAHRRDRLRLTGNGVVTETAALVYRTLLG